MYTVLAHFSHLISHTNVQAQLLENMFHNPSVDRDYYWNIASFVNTSEMGVDAAVKGSCERVPHLFESFKHQAISEVCAFQNCSNCFNLSLSFLYIQICMHACIFRYMNIFESLYINDAYMYMSIIFIDMYGHTYLYMYLYVLCAYVYLYKYGYLCLQYLYICMYMVISI